MQRRVLALAGALALAVTACNDTTSPGGTGQVAIRFSATGATSAANRVAATAGGAITPQLALTGSNGTLTIDDAQFVVSKLELEQSGQVCEGDVGSGSDGGAAGDRGDHGGDEGGDGHDDACHDFKADPFLLSLPLDGSPLTVSVDQVAAGTYDRVQFKVENLEEDEGENDGAQLADILAQIRQTYPEFPTKASAVLKGSFQPADGGAARPFTVYLQAEIEIERPIEPPLVVGAGDGAQTVTVEFDFGELFQLGGQVLDLSAFDGQTVEFEAEFEHGVRVHHED